MAPRSFLKMHGLGNDFVVFDARGDAFDPDADLVRRLADRRTGIGCDQLIVVDASAVATVRARFWNCDGEAVGACGNGSRAVAALVGGDASIETAGGLLTATALVGGASVDMGTPRFDWDAVPLAYAMDTLALPLAWGLLANPGAANVGNPHIVFFVADPDAIDLGVIGPEIEHDPVFPERINVGVAALPARDHMVLRVWERGAGLTRACGTGAVAAVAVAQRRGLADARVTVSLPGGDLVITRQDDGHLVMAGPAVIAFTGTVDLEDYR
ncbi:diaminopimelate epimerase [Polymorphobacter fuscus]|uniref:Diaminopimelate epimerase n=1 Tax=Sandarakinorhabdus fusca TaxID=1439888 RepID=A0A7C9KGZ7_9SPHN|nr:diaminopimelate epimerase [Polymorphobacter fuscus]KAB7648912.1 diaminopimelate epimerase [Polymorphobacter fuscus]MQT16500.1 diaminopimelate epimerase [Polymorphobacter fuscus]NJC07210.1 diaminopimelate epimerase [Polymorphobacter fuscus]